MPTFTGTEAEFTRFVMPYVRNYVQNLTRPAKRERDNVCQHCGKTVSVLDAAHKHGHERPAIVHELLQKYKRGDVYAVDLDIFEEELLESHSPISDHILFLCKACHREYDSSTERVVRDSLDNSDVVSGTAYPKNTGQTLPIATIPPRKKEFASLFLETGYAVIRITYCDGRQEEQDWNHRAFKEDSNVIGNLRSRPQFRQGKWQAEGIKEVLVYIPSALRCQND